MPLVRDGGFRFYIGAPLRAPNGHSIGTLCALGFVPYQPTDHQMAVLQSLANRTMQLIELRRSRLIQAASFPPYPGSAGRLLVVDDDIAVREFVCTATRQLGYAVTEAASGTEALAFMEQHAGRIDLVLTDVNMPGMDGIALAQALQKLPVPPRIAAMSGCFVPQTRAALRATGVAALLDKPFSMGELERTLQDAQTARR
jgi:CheY-like chemotaxis protein